MNKNCAFTIVAKNYIGLAQILEKSIAKYYSELDFYIIIADEMDDELIKKLPQNILVGKEKLGIDSALWNDMSFKYNLTEFCTSIKPASFKFFFESYKYDKVLYLDPDIYFFSSIGQIYDMLDNCHILLTPHITRLEVSFSGDYTELGIMQTGTFNLGFCGLKRGESSFKILDWWNKRLTTFCFNDPLKGMFTDQKWMDMLPSYFGNDLQICKHLGMNLAPWNFHEREIIIDNGLFRVRFRGEAQAETVPLIFVHYSGFDYKKLKSGSIEQRNIEDSKRYIDIDSIMEQYAQIISKECSTFDQFIDQKYTYNFYENGRPITNFHRKLYYSLTKHNQVYTNPYSTDVDSFYCLLLSKNMITLDGHVNERIVKKNIKGINSKLRIFNKFSRMAYKVLGLRRYLLFLRLLAVFSRYESQIHILEKKYDSTNIDS